MTREPSFDRRLGDWLEEGPVKAPDQILDVVLAAVPSISQRRGAAGVLRRLLSMNGYTRVLAGIAALVAIAVGAVLFLPRPAPNGVGSPSATPGSTASPTPPQSPTASPSPTPLDPTTWTSFTSSRHGITLKHPADWAVSPATAPWPIGADGPSPPDPMLDVFTDPGNLGQTFVVLSQPLAKGQTGSAWLAAYQAAAARQFPAACWPPVADWQQVTVDGVKAWIHGGVSGCAFTEAIAFTGGRVYELSAYPAGTISPQTASMVFDRPLFDAFLAGIHFDPSSADDRPIAPASASPSGS